MTGTCLDLIRRVLSARGPAPHPETWDLGTTLHYTWGPLETEGTTSKMCKDVETRAPGRTVRRTVLAEQAERRGAAPMSLRPQHRWGASVLTVFGSRLTLIPKSFPSRRERW